MATATVASSIRLTIATHNKLEQIAKDNGISKNAMIEKLIKEYKCTNK